MRVCLVGSYEVDADPGYCISCFFNRNLSGIDRSSDVDYWVLYFYTRDLRNADGIFIRGHGNCHLLEAFQKTARWQMTSTATPYRIGN